MHSTSTYLSTNPAIHFPPTHNSTPFIPNSDLLRNGLRKEDQKIRGQSRPPISLPVPISTNGNADDMSSTASQAGHRQNGDDRLKENREKADKVQETKKKATVNGELSMSSCSQQPRPDRRLRLLADHRHHTQFARSPRRPLPCSSNITRILYRRSRLLWIPTSSLTRFHEKLRCLRV